MSIIQTQRDLEKICAHLEQSPALAIDTEFIRVQTYWPILSLIQLSNGKEEFLIDFYNQNLENKPLDPTPLISLFKNPEITKILHSCRQDYEIFHKEFQILPCPLFDTQIAALLLYPEEEMGLSRLLNDLFNIDLNKTQQNTNWLQRPLSNEQISYALSDVEHLHILADELRNQLQIKDRLNWLSEEQDYLMHPQTYTPLEETIWKKVKSPRVKIRNLSAQKLVYLTKLAAWREQKAQYTNVNRGRILSDEILIQIVQSPPSTLTEIKEILDENHYSQNLNKEIWEVLELVRNIPPESWPRLKKPKQLTAKQSLLLEKVRLLQEEVSAELGISPKILSNNEDLKQFCTGNRNVPFLQGWRRDVFGLKALKL